MQIKTLTYRWLLLILITLQVVLPFLHAHTGISKQAGLHLHFATARLAGEPVDDHFSSVSTVEEHESPEVGVPPAKDKDSDNALNFHPMTQLLLVLWMFGVVSLFFPPGFWKQGLHTRCKLSFYTQSNCPPPSLAPPLAL